MMKPKLLFVWSNLARGGGEVALLNLIKKLDSCQNTILCYEKVVEFPDDPAMSITFAGSPTKSKLLKIVNKLKLLVKWLRLTHNCDIMIVNEIPFLLMLAYLVHKISGKPYIVWSHVSRNDIGSSYKKLIEYFYKYSIKNASYLVFVSNYCKNSMMQFLSEELNNFSVIHNVIDFNLHAINNSVYHRSLHDYVQIITVGRLTPEKNQMFLIESIKLFVARYNDIKIKVLIVGSGDDRVKLESTVKLFGLERVISFMGYHDNPVQLIALSDIMILPSLTEALPTVVFESLMCNVPVIATRNGASEILGAGKYGVIVDANDLEQLVQAIYELSTNNDLVQRYKKRSSEALIPYSVDEAIRLWRLVIDRVT